ncbi:hypothetical protein LXL04_036895 [Taraxacum kok-saghyz]
MPDKLLVRYESLIDDDDVVEEEIILDYIRPYPPHVGHHISFGNDVDVLGSQTLVEGQGFTGTEK